MPLGRKGGRQAPQYGNNEGGGAEEGGRTSPPPSVYAPGKHSVPGIVSVETLRSRQAIVTLDQAEASWYALIITITIHITICITSYHYSPYITPYHLYH